MPRKDGFGAVLEKDCQIPLPLRVTDRYDSKISSYGLAYYLTFLGAEAVEAMRDWLKYRVSKGWTPKPESCVWGNDRYPRVEGSIGTHRIDMIVRAAAEKSGLQKGTVWTHLLRKSFQKALNQASIDEDTKESLMGHVLPGSRGNYFDYHDVQEIGQKYGKVPLSRESSGEVVDLREDVDELRRENRELKADLALQLSRRKETVDEYGKSIESLIDGQRALLWKLDAAQEEIEDLKKKSKDPTLPARKRVGA